MPTENRSTNIEQMVKEPKFYPVDAPNAYPEPVGTLDKLEHHDGAVWVHLNGKRSKLVGLQSLAFLIGNLQAIKADVFGDQSTEQHHGEVERLRRDLHAANMALEARQRTFDTLRAQLTERDALMREASGKLIVMAARILDEPLRVLLRDLDSDGAITRIKVTDGVDQAGNSLGALAVAVRRVADSLSASAEPQS